MIPDVRELEYDNPDPDGADILGVSSYTGSMSPTLKGWLGHHHPRRSVVINNHNVGVNTIYTQFNGVDDDDDAPSKQATNQPLPMLSRTSASMYAASLDVRMRG